MWSNPFKKVDFDPELYERVMRKPPAHTRYVIYFTPRSGSSWLTDILARTRRLSLANEAFNPNFIPNIAQVCNASTLEQYINVLLRRHAQKGIYGFEITMHQFEAVFRDPQVFMEHFGRGPCFWLIREDIVAQAVSLYKMVTTKVTHAPQIDAERRAAAEATFRYDASAIKRWLNHILTAERKNEVLFREFGLSPLRMSYEQLTALGAQRTVDLVTRHLGLKKNLPRVNLESGHVKVGTSMNRDFAERFRREERDFLAKVAAERAPWLDRLDDLETLAPTG